MKSGTIVFILLSLLSASVAGADELLRTTTTWEGAKIVYPQGEPEVTSIKLKIPEGETTPFHCHPVPTMGYILKGSVEVETKSGKKMVFSEGESLVEVLGTLHRGKAVGGAVEIIVFYAGATSIPNTVLAEDDPDSKYCSGTNS
jgi:quercetin dioxygenase-like cupin family protein